MIDGIEIKLGDATFICPPAPFVCVRKYEAIFEGKMEATLSQMADILFTSLKRNYPDLKQESFEFENLDIANFKAAFQTCLAINIPKEDPSLGEPQTAVSPSPAP